MTTTLTSDSMSTAARELPRLRRELLEHPIYSAVQDLQALQLLMREHAFAVWDFMSLLKRMQQVVTCNQIPWTPAADPEASRFILEIVLGEEADDDGRGGYLSHFEMYREAMRELQADTVPINRFLHSIQAREPWEDALRQCTILPETQDFVRFSLQTALNGQPHEVAAAFFHGREDVIPDMFSRLVETIRGQGAQVERLRHYLQRHIEVDGDHHGPLARRLLNRLCADDPVKMAEAEATACAALRHRIRLWDGVLAALNR
ncbi:MAG: mangotoxin biosynthesis-involved protein MgoB [Planctomycetales bacterium 12-60-4]|nr:MAG: mangotoxin biosynthesis-involved protein MgoB [Planctomycetales bacterium 12-60-4]